MSYNHNIYVGWIAQCEKVKGVDAFDFEEDGFRFTCPEYTKSKNVDTFSLPGGTVVLDVLRSNGCIEARPFPQMTDDKYTQVLEDFGYKNVKVFYGVIHEIV